MRPGCQYVLHSTSQLYPHKRKHEKRDPDSILNTPSTTAAAPPPPPLQLASGAVLYPVVNSGVPSKQEDRDMSVSGGDTEAQASGEGAQASEGSASAGVGGGICNATAGLWMDIYSEN